MKDSPDLLEKAVGDAVRHRTTAVNPPPIPWNVLQLPRRATVLRSSWQRTGVLLAGLAVVLTVTMIISALRNSGLLASNQIAQAPTTLTGLAKVDSRAGKISLPLDQYEITPAEDGILQTANDLAMHRCMAAAGFPKAFAFIDRRHPTPDVDWRYGVWVRSQVARSGYQPPALTARGKLLRKLNAKRLSTAADAAYQRCIPQIHALGLVLPARPAWLSPPAITDALREPQAQTAIGDWVKCLVAQGVKRPTPENPWTPAGVNTLPLPEQIRIGLIDVGCKESHSTIQRLADVEASAQQPFVEANQTLLQQWRQQQFTAVERARGYLANAPEVHRS